MLAGKDTWMCVAFESQKHKLRVKNAVRSYDDPVIDVVKPDWLEGMVAGKRPSEPEPHDLIHMTQKTKDRLKTTHDAHGDSYTWPASRESVQKLLDNWKVNPSKFLNFKFLRESPSSFSNFLVVF